MDDLIIDAVIRKAGIARPQPQCESADDFEAMSTREFIVFYAWQNDKSSRENRYLIRTALGIAAKRITADASIDVRVRVDSDTQGVLGQPPVAATILAKIDACDVFVPTSRLWQKRRVVRIRSDRARRVNLSQTPM